ncbi:hypothetical protein [Paenibacillus yonginensis]|uniref:hypothetical protein n=1 Tax=Paenibacillus yonginensis TaxID=1462996 RepID=UPI000838C2B1|nr:hypothetical protein [Paenibacillus yonginensis]
MMLHSLTAARHDHPVKDTGAQSYTPAVIWFHRISWKKKVPEEQQLEQQDDENGDKGRAVNHFWYCGPQMP